MTKIYLIRHAEAEGNIYRRAHGQFNGQIIGRGYMQIEQLRKRFEHEIIDAVYSSDLDRTRVTAAAIYESHGLPLNTTDRLREVNVGVWEDVAWGDIEHQDPEMSWCFGQDPARWHVNGSEDYMHVRARMTERLIDIARKYDGGTVAVFSHGFAIRAFICGLLGVKSEDVAKVPYCDNTAVTLLVYEGGELRLEYQSDNSHLSSEISTFAHQTWWREETEWISENLHYMTFDEQRDFLMRQQSGRAAGEGTDADKEYTAFLADKPIGLVGINTVKESKDGAGWISCIFISPDFQRKNYGIQLLGHAISFFRKLGREKLRVEVGKDSAAFKFCRKFEFEVIGDMGAVCVLEKNIRNW